MSEMQKTYLQWLSSQIRTPGIRSYDGLFMVMNGHIFSFSIDNDENRIADALALRAEFTGRKPQSETVSVLEVLIALSRRLEFQAEGAAEMWAWKLLDNLGLMTCYDPIRNYDPVVERLEALVWRQYDANGQGGFFPLIDPQQDQREVEVWYQMAAYLEEENPEL